jgi:ABC-2 type transport system ATP-binding protein
MEGNREASTGSKGGGMTASPRAITATGLRKSFGEQVVLDGIDLDVAEGKIFALLGPNGAGKTTAMRIMLGVLAPDAGQVRWCRHR